MACLADFCDVVFVACRFCVAPFRVPLNSRYHIVLLFIYLFHNSTAKRKHSGRGRAMLTALTATLRNEQNENESSYNKY